MEALQRAWDLDTSERHKALAQAAASVQNDAELTAFAQEAIKQDVAAQYDMSVCVLGVLKSSGATSSNPTVAQLVYGLTSSVFSDVRHSAASSGLITDDMALEVLQTGRDDLRKAILKARATNLYGFGFNASVAKACDEVFEEKAQYWKINLGGDAVQILKETPPSPETMTVLAGQLSLEVLHSVFKQIEGIAHPKWLQRYIRRIEDADPAEEIKLNATICDIIDVLLYKPKVWMGDIAAGATKIMRFIWRRWGPEASQALQKFNSKADPVITFSEMVRLSRYTSWDQQLKAFNGIKERLLDMPFETRADLLLKMRPVNKAPRSRHCDGLVGLAIDLTTTPQERLTLFDKLIQDCKLPPMFLADYYLRRLLEQETLEQLPVVFRQCIAILSSPQAPKLLDSQTAGFEVKVDQTKKRRKKKFPSPPFKEYLTDPKRVGLFEGTVDHKDWFKIKTIDDVSQAFRVLVDRCDKIDMLRKAASIYIRTLADRVTADMLLHVVKKMSSSDEAEVVDVKEKGLLRKHTTDLPEELLKFMRSGSTAEGQVLLYSIRDAQATKDFVGTYGRKAWWRLLLYGLNGPVPKLGRTLDPPIKEEDKQDYILVGEEKDNIKEDTEFEERLKDACSGVDLFKRSYGLVAVLRSLNAEEFRLQRMAYVAQRLLAEPENTKSEVVPQLLMKVRGVQDFVTLASHLEPLWKKCAVSNMSASMIPSFVRHAQSTMTSVVNGALVPDAQGALLARTIVTGHGKQWVQDLLVNNAKKMLPIPGALIFTMEAAEAAVGPPETAPNYSRDILAMTLRICKQIDLKPAEFVAAPWAKPFLGGLGGSTTPFVLHVALEQLAAEKVLDWSPIASPTLQRALNGVRDLPPKAAVELLRLRLVALLQHQELIEQHNKEAETDKSKQVLDSTGVDAHIATTVQRLEQIIQKLPEIYFDACMTSLFSNISWSVHLQPEHVITVASAFLKKTVFSVDGSVFTTLLRLLMTSASSLDNEAERVVKYLAERPDAVVAMVLSPEFTKHLVSFKPALLRTMLERFYAQEKKKPETKPVASLTPNLKKVSVITRLAVALKEPLKRSHLPARTAKVLADVLLLDSGLDSSECLALLLREVDSLSHLTKRVLALEDHEATLVLRAAATAGHPVRTVQLCTSATGLKETAHRDVFDRAIADMPNGQARVVIQKVLEDPSTGPGVTKRMLRLSKDNRLSNPMGLLLAAWRDGQCHKDVKVFLLHTLSIKSPEDDAKGEAKQIEAVFDASKMPIKSLSYVASQVVEVLSTRPIWESVPLLRFLSQTIDLTCTGGFKALTAFTFVLSRLETAGQTEEVFAEPDAAVDFLTQLLERAALLCKSDLHGQKSVSDSWQGIGPDAHWFRSPNFGVFARQCKPETVQRLILAMVAHLSNPATQMDSVICVWANALLRPNASAATTDAQVSFMLDLADAASEKGKHLHHLSVLASHAVRRGTADDTQGGSAQVREAAIRVIQWVKNMQCGAATDEKAFLPKGAENKVSYVRNFVKDRTQLASRKGTPAEDVISVLKESLACDHAVTKFARLTNPDAENAYNIFQTALSHSQSCEHHMPILEFLCQDDMRADMMKLPEDVTSTNLQQHALAALRDKGDGKRICSLLLPFQALPGLSTLPDTFLSFEEDAATMWVTQIVQAEEKVQEKGLAMGMSGTSARTFSDRVIRHSRAVLIKSNLPMMRLQALRFLEDDELAQICEADSSYGVRTVAYAIANQRKANKAKKDKQKK